MTEGESIRFAYPTTQQSTGAAWRVDESYVAFLEAGGHGLLWEVNGQQNGETALNYDAISMGYRKRSQHEVPEDPGVCLPHGFIRDSRSPGRFLASTYRLRDHPDITIWLKDQTVFNDGAKSGENSFSPEYESDTFWTSYQSSDRKELKSVWQKPYRSIQFANTEGLESFVRIVRNNDSVDFGYLVVAQESADTKVPAERLMFYVVQDSKNAKAKNIPPLGKDAFIEIAQSVAASVKRRTEK